MKFKATPEQIAALSANAFNASVPMGMGFLHFNPRKVTAEDFLPTIKSGHLNQDYTEGRMVKLYLSKANGEEDTYELPDNEPRADYQSWVSTYPSYKALVESAGISV